MRHSRLNGLNAEEKHVYSKIAEVYIHFYFSHVGLLLEIGALSIKCSKTLCFFERAPRRLLLCDLKDAKVIRSAFD